MILLFRLLQFVCTFISLVLSAVHLADIDLKTASKFFATKFSCGSSVTGDDEIVIQGDVKDELFDIIPEKWPDVSSFHLQLK